MDATDPRVEWLVVAGAALARREGEDTRLRRAPRDAGDAAHGAQPPRAAGKRRLPRGAVAGAARHRGRALPRARRSKPARVHRSGGEGRNFEFCRRLVLFDLPWKPSIVEQRIGRLDRIGRRIPVEIVYFRPPAGIGSGRRAALRGARSLPRAARRPRAATGPRRRRARRDRARSAGIAFRQNASRRSSATPTRRARASAKRRISSSIAIRTGRTWPQASSRAFPRSSTRSTRKWSITACIGLGFTIEHPRGRRVFAIELGQRMRWSTACLASPAARAMSARSTARRRWRTRPSTSSRPGIRWSRGSLPTSRTARSAVSCGSRSRSARERGAGLVAIYKDGPRSRSSRSTPPAQIRPDWAAAFRQRPLRARPMSNDVNERIDWAGMVRQLGTRLDAARRPHALAAIGVRPLGGT